MLTSSSIDTREPALSRITAMPISEVRAQLAKLQQSEQRMRKVNSHLRNKNTGALREMGYSATQIDKLLEGESGRANGGHYTCYRFNNVAAKIRTCKAQLRAADAAPVTHEGQGFVHTRSEVAITFQFDVKPDKPTRAVLRRHGFVRQGAAFQYSRDGSSAAMRAARSVLVFLA